MRRRSPSPVVTGNVSRARMRFESGGSVKNNKTSPSPVPSGFEPMSCQHQTLPRTFRFMNSNHNNGYLESRTTVNRFLSGSSYNNINTVIIRIELTFRITACRMQLVLNLEFQMRYVLCILGTQGTAKPQEVKAGGLKKF